MSRWASWAIIGILAIALACVSVPRPICSDCGLRSKDASLRSDLKIYRNAIQLFQKDTGALPRTLEDLSAVTAPSSGCARGLRVPIDGKKWQGPYIDSVMTDPVSGNPFLYNPRTGTIQSSDPDHTTW